MVRWKSYIEQCSHILQATCNEQCCHIDELRDRFIEHIAETFDEYAIEPLKAHTDLLMAIVKRARRIHKQKLDRVAEELKQIGSVTYNNLGSTPQIEGQRPGAYLLTT